MNSTKQITSAMKMVSASKLRRAQERILGLRPYYTELKSLMKQVTFDVPFQIHSPFYEKRTGGNCLIVVISSNRGLCGVFNSNLSKYLGGFPELPEFKDKFDQSNIFFLVLGRRIGDYLRKKQANIVERRDDITEKPLTSEVFKLTDGILQQFQEGKWDEIYLVYNQFRNPALQEVVHERLLPLDFPQIEPEFFYPEIGFIYQPDIPSIVDSLIPEYLKASVLKAILESSAGEHGARMTAMHKATDNATEIIKDLKLTYNKARQAAITKEIIEIVSGANALD